ncbi:MAG: LacI family DNA-binding transcriptional regulator [Allomuricauda sp.]
MPTLKQIAEDLNISASTISRILNGKGKESRISDATVAHVLKYAEEVGYSPNLIAKSLQASQTFTIGLMVPDIANPFFATMAKNIENWASRAKHSIILIDSNEDVEKEKKQLLNMMGRKVDGLIVAPVGDSYQHFSKIVRQKVPLIFVDRYFTDSTIPYITSDNYQGSYAATQELIEKGHRKICLISGSSANQLVQERTQGYIDALKNADIELTEKQIVGNSFSVQNGYESTQKVLRQKSPPTAIFAMNNLIGFGVLKAVKELGLNIPQAVSIIIFDDHPYLSLLKPSISAVKQNSEKIGELAVKAILKEINQDSDISSMRIPTELILRESISKLPS